MMNHLQTKVLEQCIRHKLSVEETFETLKAQQELCKKMGEYADEVYKRKVWKKSVMTVSNYGATQLTSRKDVLQQLKVIDSKFLLSCTPSEVTMFTNMVFWSMETGVPSTMKFLHYFRKLFSFVLKHKDEILFVNPLTGFPVCLKVCDEEMKCYRYRVHNRPVSSRIYRKLKTTNKRKTVSSSVPSVLHCIDAAILSLIKSGLDCDVSYIHDSIGVHPNNLGKAKVSVHSSLAQVLSSDVYKSIATQLLDGIENVPMSLYEVPVEDTWDGDMSDTYYAYS